MSRHPSKVPCNVEGLHRRIVTVHLAPAKCPRMVAMLGSPQMELDSACQHPQEVPDNERWRSPQVELDSMRQHPQEIPDNERWRSPQVELDSIRRHPQEVPDNEHCRSPQMELDSKRQHPRKKSKITNAGCRLWRPRYLPE